MLELIKLDPGKLQDTITIFLAIVIEATPFIIIGILSSVIIKAFIDPNKLLKLTPKNPFLSHLTMSLLGIVFPVCECGNVPLLRQLIAKGVPISSAVSFYLGAPVLNIAVVASTYIAFGPGSIVFWARFLIGFLIAYLVGLFLYFTTDNNHKALTKSMQIECAHDHTKVQGKKFLFSSQFFDFFHKELKSMFALLVFGAFVASITQIWIPRDLLLSLNSSPFVAVTAMMVIAVIISVCSTVDAFIALGFSQTFSNGALLGFLVYGPMIDIKALSMLSTTFNIKFLIKVVSAVTILTYLFTLILINLGY